MWGRKSHIVEEGQPDVTARFTAPLSDNAERAAELEALRRDFPRYGFETHVLAGQEHYTARRRPGQRNAGPYSVTTADLAKLRHELTISATKLREDGCE
jgi:hypothetical protein